MIAYPDFLPGPLLAGYTLNQQSNLLRSEMDSGQARVRRRFANVPSTISATWLFTENQAAWFSAFIEQGLVGGIAWFEMPIKTPFGIKTGQLRFIGNPLEAGSVLSPTLWQYKSSIELKTLPKLIDQSDDTTVLVNMAKFISDADMSRYYQ